MVCLANDQRHIDHVAPVRPQGKTLSEVAESINLSGVGAVSSLSAWLFQNSILYSNVTLTGIHLNSWVRDGEPLRKYYSKRVYLN